MSSLLYEVRIIRFEGLDSYTSCDVFINDRKAFSLFPKLSEIPLQITKNTTFKICLFSNDMEYSVSFMHSLFEDDGMVWLPLFSTGHDILYTQPEDVFEPRLLLLVHKKFSEEHGIETEDFMPEIKLSCQTLTLPNEIMCVSSINSSFRSEPNSHHSEHIEQSENHESLLEISLKANDAIEQNEKHFGMLYEISAYYQDTLNKQKKITDKVLVDIEEKNKELSHAFSQILNLQTKLQRYEAENNYLKNLNSGFLGSRITELLSELEEYKKKCTDLQQKSEEKQSHRIEALLKDECEKMNIETFVKEPEEVFMFNGKKVNLVLRDGKIFCRTGNKYKEFKEYVKENSENKPNTQATYSHRTPIRKGLAELNHSIDTPRQTTKKNEISKTAKAKTAHKPTFKPTMKPLRKICN